MKKKKHWTTRIVIEPYSSKNYGWFSWFLFVSTNISQNWKFHQQHFGFYFYFSDLESNNLWEEEDEEEEESTNPSWTNEELIPHSRQPLCCGSLERPFFFVSSSSPHFSIVLLQLLANFSFAIFVFSTFFCTGF